MDHPFNGGSPRMTSLPGGLLEWGVVLAGALIAGFISGFAGFGTGLVAAAFWFYALPASMVPPLVALASVVAQLVGLFAVRASFAWRRAAPYLIGGVIGVPIGVTALGMASPAMLRLTVGLLLIGYAAFQLTALARMGIANRRRRAADGAIGLAGGFLGGFAGLSGVLPLLWLQLQGGTSAGQRATYQPFNLIVLAIAGIAMAIGGHVTEDVLIVTAAAVPATLLGAMAGVRAYARASEAAFKRLVLVLLLASGTGLVLQTLAG
jgi:uncharacterized membrane protein YfcA